MSGQNFMYFLSGAVFFAVLFFGVLYSVARLKCYVEAYEAKELEQAKEGE